MLALTLTLTLTPTLTLTLTLTPTTAPTPIPTLTQTLTLARALILTLTRCGARHRMHRRQQGLQLLQRAVLVWRHDGLARAVRTWVAACEFQARHLHPYADPNPNQS